MLASELPDGRGGEHAVAMLGGLFDDDDEKVRDVAASVFRRKGMLGQTFVVPLAERFVQSHAFENNIEDLLYGFKDATISLRPFSRVLSLVVQRFAGSLAPEGRDLRSRRPADVGTLAEVLLRLYEQSEGDRRVRGECLDAWDQLLRGRVGLDVLKHIDS